MRSQVVFAIITVASVLFAGASNAGAELDSLAAFRVGESEPCASSFHPIPVSCMVLERPGDRSQYAVVVAHKNTILLVVREDSLTGRVQSMWYYRYVDPAAVLYPQETRQAGAPRWKAGE